MKNYRNTAGVIALPPLIYGIPLIATIVIDHALSNKRLAPPLRLLSLGFFAAAGSLVAPSFREFGKANTPVDPFAETTSLVQSGPFQYTRNPIYAGLTMAYTSIALAAGSALPLRALPMILWLMNVGVIEREERYLEEKFGDAYRAYRMRVPRWF